MFGFSKSETEIGIAVFPFDLLHCCLEFATLSCPQKSNQLLHSYRVDDIILHSLGYFN